MLWGVGWGLVRLGLFYEFVVGKLVDELPLGKLDKANRYWQTCIRQKIIVSYSFFLNFDFWNTQKKLLVQIKF